MWASASPRGSVSTDSRGLFHALGSLVVLSRIVPMPEIYTFTAKVVSRFKSRIQITPEDRDAFEDYLERSGISRIHYWRNGTFKVSVSDRAMIEMAKDADRVRYSVQKRGTRMFGVRLEPLR